MSPRAAWRLESLGFGEVYDYVAGKLDWMAAGLRTEGTNAAHPRAGGWWACFCARMLFALQERRNERPHHHSQEVFKVRSRHRDMRVLRRARLSGHHLLSMCERHLSRPTPVQAGHLFPYSEVTPWW